jgi:threonine synthase
MPISFPQFDPSELKKLDYPQLIAKILHAFADDNFSYKELEEITQDAYKALQPQLIKLEEEAYLLNLSNGPSLSFKDYALQVLARLMDLLLAKLGHKINIITATSGDTGAAAVEAFSGRKNIHLFVLHPKGKISEIQRRQMTSVDAKNITNIAVEGTFDECQNLVKSTLQSGKFSLTTINSINFVRIIIQMGYYIHTLLKFGLEPLNFVVPTGNFGNILSAYLTNFIGLKTGKLIIALNANKALNELENTGVFTLYQTIPTLANAMDISLPSNFERFIYHTSNSSTTKTLYENLKTTGEYNTKSAIYEEYKKYFHTLSLGDEEILAEIERFKNLYDITIDPHTATATKALVNGNINGKKIVVCTADPAKFSNFTGTLPQALQKLLKLTEKYHTISNDLLELERVIGSFCLA